MDTEISSGMRETITRGVVLNTCVSVNHKRKTMAETQTKFASSPSLHENSLPQSQFQLPCNVCRTPISISILNAREQVTMKTLMADPRNRHYFGLNRPEQTGEAESHGFRTSAHADAAPALPTLDPTGDKYRGQLMSCSLAYGKHPVRIECSRYYRSD